MECPVHIGGQVATTLAYEPKDTSLRVVSGMCEPRSLKLVAESYF
jgi:hypothetical protein